MPDSSSPSYRLHNALNLSRTIDLFFLNKSIDAVRINEAKRIKDKKIMKSSECFIVLKIVVWQSGCYV